MSLIVKPISANLTKDKDFFGKSDPYVVVSVGNSQQKSRPCNGGGKTPSWTDTFQFTGNDQLLRVQVYDKDTFSRDDLIGEGSINLMQFYQNPSRTENCNKIDYLEYIDLINRGKSAGRVLLSIQYQGPQKGGFGGNQGGWGNQASNQPNQGNWGGNQGGWGNQRQQGQGWGNQGGGWNGPPQNQGNWGNQGGYGPNYGSNQGMNMGKW